MKPKGIMICVPAYGQSMTMQTAETLFSVGAWLTRQGIPNQLSLFSAADIVEVRNLFLTVWYDGHPEFSHMLFIDADMGFHPMLIKDMIKFGKPLMGVLYVRRQMPASVIGSLPEGHTIKDVVNGFMKATDLGCGVMMIAREVVDAMVHQMPELCDSLPSVLCHATPIKLHRLIRAFDPIREGNKRLSEDVSFCRRYNDCGGEIWANVDHKISHVGPFDYHLRYAGVLENKAEYARQQAAQEAEAA